MISHLLRGFVDGALSTLGIAIGASAATSSIIIAATLGGALANGISNALSAFSAEGVERYRELREIEQAMVARELRQTELDRRVSRRTVKTGLVDGLGTVFGGLIPILPYFFLDTLPAMLTAIGAVVVVTALIGIYLGKLSRRNLAFSALKMAFFTLVVAGVVYLVEALIVPAE